MDQTYDPRQLLSEAYGQYAPAIFRHCWCQTCSREDAEELTQDVFLRTWEYLRGGHTVDNMKTFLYRVSDNLIIDMARRRKRRKTEEVSLEALQEKGFDPGQDETEHIREKLEVWKILMEVSGKETYRLLTMRYLEGMVPTDIASILGVTPNVVSVRLHRALKDLSQLSAKQKEAKKLQSILSMSAEK